MINATGITGSGRNEVAACDAADAMLKAVTCVCSVIEVLDHGRLTLVVENDPGGFACRAAL